MYFSDILVRRDGTIKHTPKIQLFPHGGGLAIPVGIGPRRYGTYVHLSLSAERQLAIREPYTRTTEDGTEQKGERRYLAEAEVVIGGHGKPLIVKPWLKSLIDDRILVLLHIESGNKGKAWIDPDPQVLKIASGEKWRKDKIELAYLGEICEVLLVMTPGQMLTWRRTGKSIKTTHGAIVYCGRGKADRFSFTSPQDARKVG